MSEENDRKKKPSAEHEALVDRYQRRSGTARKEERPGFWKRMKGWVTPGSPESPRPQAPPEDSPTDSSTDSSTDSPTTSPTDSPTDSPMNLGQQTVELVLPDQKKLVVRGRVQRDPTGGILQLYVDPPPTNTPHIIQALSAAEPTVPATGGIQAVLTAELPPLPGETSSRRAAMERPATHADQTPTQDLPVAPPASEVAAPEPPGFSGATPLPPLGRESEQEILPPLEMLGSTPPEIDPDIPEIETHHLEPPHPAAAPPSVSRGGAAERLFQETEQTARNSEIQLRNRPTEPQRPVPQSYSTAGTLDGQAVRQPPQASSASVETAIPQQQSPPASPAPVSAQQVQAPGSAPAPGQKPPAPTTAPGDSSAPILGIDFGTSYSSVALIRAGVEVIPVENGLPQMASVLSFPNPGEVLIGGEARKRMGGEAHYTIVSPKRLLGRMYKDPQVSQLIGGLAFKTFAGTDKLVRFEAHGEIYSATDICALILGELKKRASQHLKTEVNKAVFAVPVGFGTLQRSALEMAAKQAGLTVVGLITEPSAAVLSHGYRPSRGLVAVYDFGGGTFDFSVLEVSETVFNTRCAGGDPWLGGDDFDNAMANHFADRFWNEIGVDLRNRAVEWQALVFACEQAKRELSSKTSAEIRLDDLLMTAEGTQGLRYKISRKEFVKLVQHLIDKSIAITERVMQQAGIQPKQVDAVVLTGGTSLIPAVRDAVTKFFGKKPIKGDPDLAVVHGSALRAAELGGEAVGDTPMGGRTIREVAGRTIGAGPQGGQVITLFERDTPVPAEVFKAFFTLQDNQTEMVIGLYEESKSRVDLSRTIGHLRYKGLRPAPAGQARIDCTFFLDEDGILHVTAVVEGKEYSKAIRLG